MFGEFPSLRFFLGSKVPQAKLAERAQAAQIAHKIMAEAQEKIEVKKSIKKFINQNETLRILTCRKDTCLAKNVYQ